MPRRDPGKFKRRKKVCNVNIKRICRVSENESVGLGIPGPSTSYLCPALSRPTPPTQDDVPKRVSSSKKKLDPMKDEYELFQDVNNDSECYDIVNLKRLESLVAQVAVCAECSGPVILSTSNRQGLSVLISIRCKDCGLEASEYNDNSCGKPNSGRKSNNEKSEINTRLVYGFRCIGKGEEGAKKLCGVLNLPSPPSFKYYTSILCNAAREVCLKTMKDAVEETVIINDGSRDITANFDGTWQRRGHRSLNGVVSAISGITCKVLDIRIFSKFCRCKQRLQNHHEANCVANYEGASGGMEVEGVLDMFRSSVPQYDIRYKYFLGDGDSAAFPAVVQSEPYGSDFVVEKLECIGHVQKRMGARLDNFKKKKGKDKLEDGKTLGGRNRLTGVAIKEIQLYYGLAIRRNTASLEDMTRAVWAEFYHLSSTNAKPQHGLCPKGLKTWCKYRIATDNGEQYDHTKHLHIPPTIMEEIRPIFRDLSKPELLRKCLHGGTQNANESLNSTIWSRIPKSTFVMKQTLEFGAYEAVACYNIGNVAKCHILKTLGISPGYNFINVMKKADELRIKKAEKANEKIEKKIRKQASLLKNKLEDTFREAEDQDKPAYGAGLY